MINYRDYPGTIPTPKSRKELTKLAEKMLFKVKKAPSPAQVKQRHKFMLTGTLASMESRLHQLYKDPMIPRGKLRARLLKTLLSVRVARTYLQDTEMQLGGRS